MSAMGGKKFPEGLWVLAVDDDCVCLKVMEAILRRCKYNPTMVMDAKTALKMLRAGKQEFDLVITDVRMPGMDGFKLLELIHLEMNLPVIMLSVDCDKKAVMKGITHGACDYLVKPVRTNELRNIWQHVERRRNLEAISHISIDDETVQPETVAKTTDSESNDVDDFGESIESMHISITKKKPRVAWTIELHNKFLEAIHQIGLDRAAPKTVLELMKVDYLTRENIESHLQKYRLHRKRVNSNPVGDAHERRKLSYGNMNNKGSFMRNHEHEIWRVSSGRMTISSPNHLSATGNLAHLTNTQRNLCMKSFTHGGSTPRYVVPQPSDAIRFPGSSNPPASQYNILNVDEFSTYNSVDSYADLMRGKLVETSKAKPPSNLRSSFANTSSSSGSSTPTNEYVVHPQESIKKYHNIMNVTSTQVGNPSKFPGLVGDYTKSWQSTGILHRCGTSFAPSHVNISRTQLAKYATPSFQMPLQIETTPFIRNTSSGEGFIEQAVPLNTPNNQSYVRMLDVCDSAPMAPSEMVKGGGITTSSVQGFREQMVPFNISRNTSSIGTMPNGNPALVTNILDGKGTTDIHVVQEYIVDQPALNDQLDDINDFSWGDIFSNPLNEIITFLIGPYLGFSLNC